LKLLEKSVMVNLPEHRIGDEPVLTIAIPFYLGKKYIAKAIESVLAQSDSRWKLIICNDGPDGRLLDDLVLEYNDLRISIYQNESRLGMVGNWNRCLDMATTDLVTILHDDDELLPNYASMMIEASERYPSSAAFFCNAIIIDANSARKFSLPDYVKKYVRSQRARLFSLSGASAFTDLLKGNYIMCPTLCYRKSRILERRFSSKWRFVQDWDFSLRLLMEGETLVGINEIAYAYRRHKDNATTRYTDDLTRFIEEVRLCEEMANWSSRVGWTESEKVAKNKHIIKLNLAYCILMDLLSFRLDHMFRKTRFLSSLWKEMP
jgi:glycosyltransferase involved in cell wall biosynthesis